LEKANCGRHKFLEDNLTIYLLVSQDMLPRTI
jgi:hypothetical protein